MDVFGVSPEPDTMLGPSHATVGLRATKFSQSSAALFTPPITWLRANTLHLVLNNPHGPSVTLSYATVADRWHGLNYGGNLLAGVGYRYVTSVLDSMRAGVAIRVAAGGSPSETNASALAMNRFAARSPFHAQELAFDRPIEATLEGRMEMVGCHAPFVHLRVDFVHWRADAFDTQPEDLGKKLHAVRALPISLAVGGFIRPYLGFSAQVGVEVRGPTDVLLMSSLWRLRAVLDFRVATFYPHLRGWHIVAHSDALTGDAVGVEVGLAAQFDGRYGDAIE